MAIAQCAAIAHIPTKKANHPAIAYLEADEVEAILRQPDQSKLEGQRDYALLAFLYNTGRESRRHSMSRLRPSALTRLPKWSCSERAQNPYLSVVARNRASDQSSVEAKSPRQA